MITDKQRIHAHAFPCAPNSEDVTGPCDCGLTWEDYHKLLLDKRAGRPHAAATTKPIDQYGRAVDEQPEIAGQVIIAWPQKQDGGQSLNPGMTTFTDAQTGKLLPTINANLTFGFDGPEIRGTVLIAELTLFCSKDGEPLAADSRGLIDFSFGLDLKPLTAKFNYHVVEMRVGP